MRGEFCVAAGEEDSQFSGEKRFCDPAAANVAELVQNGTLHPLPQHLVIYLQLDLFSIANMPKLCSLY